MASRPWMDYSMSYFKIKVGEDAIYKLDQNNLINALSNAGFNYQAIDSNKWAIFFRGEEISIHYEKGNIFFFGERNDATLDTGMYFEGGLANPNVNIFSDTSAYFLSWYTDSRVGKRMNTINVPNPVTINYHFDSRQWKPNNYGYFIGQNYNHGNGAELLMGSFQQGEGWTGPRSSSNLQMLVDSISNYFNSGPPPYLNLRLLAEGNSNNSIDISLGSNSPRLWQNNQGAPQPIPINIKGEILPSDIESGSLQIDGNINSGRFSSVYAQLYYPQNIGMFGARSKVFTIDSTIANELKIKIDDISINNPSDLFAMDITDPLNVHFCEKTYNSALGELTIELNDANSKKRRILVSLRTDVKDVSNIEYRLFQDLSSPDQDFLIVYPNQFDSAAGAYFDYRKSTAGGSYKPLKIEVEEVFDQFSFGEITPVGIRELCRYMHNNSSANSNYLFLMGKGLLVTALKRINNTLYRYRFNPELFTYKNLVPTFGYPGGDWPYVMNFNDQNPNEIAFGVGRIVSRTEQQVFQYLEKVKEYENPINDGLWRKRMLHLSGGVTDVEIQRFSNYIDQFKAIAEGPFLGAKVQTINKTKPAGVQNIFIDTVINKGISLLTMYGHSSAQFNDIEIGDINDPNLNYNNSNGQYPMFIINGCESGQIFRTFESWAQNWINEPNKGATLMLAHSYVGFDPILRFYTDEIYKTAFSDSLYFGKPIGDILTRSCNNFNNQYSIFYGKYIQSQLELMTFQGDPALRISGGLGNSDYAVRESDIEAISFDGEKITTNTDSFQLKIPLENWGRFSDEFVGLLVERESPVNSLFDTVYIPSFGYSDTVYYTIYNTPDNLSLGGLNEFTIRADPGNLISEDNESNNVANFSLLLPIQYVRNISPINFGIVPNTSVRLVSSAQLPENLKSIIYQYEIDTSYRFDSPIKQTYQYSSGNTGIWDFDLPIQNDSTVYFWRSKKLEDTVWSESSFTFINSSPSGWSQSTYGQYIKNNYSGGLILNDTSEIFEFLDFSSDLEIRFAGQKAAFRDTTLIKIGNALLRKNSNLEARTCESNRLLAVRISGQTGQAIRDLSAREGRNCGIQPMGVRQLSNYNIRVDSIRNSLMNYINDTEQDDYVLLIAHGLVNFNTISPALRDTLESFGLDSALWDDLENYEPFLFLGRRNWSGSFYIRGDTTLALALDSQVVDLNYTLTETYRTGTVESVKIGPAKSWTSLNFNLKKEQNDKSRMDLLGSDLSGGQTLLFSDLSEGTTDLSSIDAAENPNIYLRAYFEDSVDRTSPQLDSWTVIYEGTAEGLIDPLAFGDEYYGDISIQEGDTLQIQFSFKNISDFDFSDSLRVTFSLGEDINSEIWIESPKSNDSTLFTYEMITSGLKGDYTLRTFVNPFDQGELFYDNNILETDFNIFEDQIPPIISALFDGEGIVNNDVVAYNTEIKLTLKDENPYFRLIDTSAIFFELYKNENFIDSLINFSSEEMVFKPQTDTSDYHLMIFPDSLHDGSYRLEFNGRDASGNLAGPFPKVIEFQVQTAIPSEFDLVSIFPNPFQNALDMTFNLSGSNKPNKFEVSFYDLNGKRIFRNDFSELVKLGDNRIEIWDAKNSEGEEVPSGMYIYSIQIEGTGLGNLSSEPIVGKIIFSP